MRAGDTADSWKTPSFGGGDGEAMVRLRWREATAKRVSEGWQWRPKGMDEFRNGVEKVAGGGVEGGGGARAGIPQNGQEEEWPWRV